MEGSYEQLLKLIVVGDSGTGKSSLQHRFIHDAYATEHNPTVGVEFGSKVVDLGGHTVKLQIWDTAGQERYRSVTRSYYRSAAGCLLVYDITNRSSFESVPRWLEDVKRLAGEDVVVMLIGNKSDLKHQNLREVTHNEASVFAQENNLLHFETSALSGEFVVDAFLKVARVALDKKMLMEPPTGDVNLADESTSYNAALLRCCF